MITANNIFPRGTSSVHFRNVARSIITANRFHSFYPGMLVFEGNCSENMVSSNHFLRDNEPWAPMLEYDNGLDDLYGILCISGNNNSVIANHISEIIHTQSIKPAGAKPVIIHIVSGKGNYISDNHIVATTEATDEQTKASDSCFSAQVDALTTTDKLVALDVTAVLVEKESVQNTILDSGSEGQVIVALGGGSSIDTAKGIGIVVNNPDFADVKSVEGVAATRHKAVPTFALPTTAGTAAEVTINYVIIDEDVKKKMVCVDPNDIPVVAIVDPELMYSMPKGLTAATGMDALTHAIESYITPGAILKHIALS